MIEEYLSGSVRQSTERVRQLRGIVQSRYPREYDGLRQLCLAKLDQALGELNALAGERIIDIAIQTPRRVRVFKRVVEQINNVEGIGVFALHRANAEDAFLNRLITDICSEISYPLITPVICHMSQDYFHIYPDFNLLCLPLIESRFLLHLPDVYHELCHPLHSNRNLELPALEPYARSFKRMLFDMVGHFQAEYIAADRLRNQEARLFQLQLWRNCWTKYWTEEFFCDLFGVLTVGPAYAWSHYHLCVKRGGDPFTTPLMFEDSHPADDARIRAMLGTLRLFDCFRKDAETIATAWQEFVNTMGYKAGPEYYQCYPDTHLGNLLTRAKEGVEGIGVQLADSQKSGQIRALLNQAWRVFWEGSTTFHQWETARISELRSQAAA
jgi:hypothetical protein